MLVSLFALSDATVQEPGFSNPRPVAAVASGAYDPSPPNGSLDGNGYAVGTEPTNFDFEAGNLSGWTTIASPFTIQGDPISGYYGRLGNTAKAVTSAFTVPADAQILIYERQFQGGGTNCLQVKALWGAGFTNTTTLMTISADCGSSGSWGTIERNITSLAGETIKLEFYATGQVGIDEAGRMSVEAPLWDVTDGAHSNVGGTAWCCTPTVLDDDGPEGNYLRVPNVLNPRTAFFTVPDNALTFIYWRRLGTTSGFHELWAWCDPASPAKCGPTEFPTLFPLVNDDTESRGSWVRREIDISWAQGLTLQFEFHAADVFDVDIVGLTLSQAHKAGDPVDTASGAFTHSHTDIVIPGKGIPLEFTRAYNSQGAKGDGSLGFRWYHNYSWSLDFLTGTNINVNYPDGNVVTFTESGGDYTPQTGVFDTLVENGDDSFTYTTKAAVVFNFTSAGQLTSILDRNGNTTTVSYDGNGYISEVEDAGGRTLDFTVDGSGRITDIDGPLSRSVGFTYDEAGDLTEVDDVKSGTTTYTYNNHRMTSLTDSNGNLANQNIYDAANRVVEQEDAEGGISCFYYGTAPAYTSDDCTGVSPAADAGETVYVNPAGKKTTYGFDSSSLTTYIEDHDGNLTSFSYDSDQNLVCVTDPLSHRTGYTHDSNGNATGMIDANNTDVNCDLDGGGVKWTYTYTALNDLDLVTDPRGNKTAYVYDSSGNLVQVKKLNSSDAEVQRTCMTRDSDGLVTEVIESTSLVDCTGNLTVYGYDRYGNVASVTNAQHSGGANVAPSAVKVGFFIKKSGATGTQTIMHYLGVEPKAIIIWSDGQDVEGNTGDYHVGFGFSDGTTSHSIATSSDDGLATSNASRRQSDALFTMVLPDENHSSTAELDS